MTRILTGRPATTRADGLVTSPHSLASAAGLDLLRAGGSAVDAALATSAALSVLYPHMTGIGGDAFWLIHDARTARSATSTAAARHGGRHDRRLRAPRPQRGAAQGRAARHAHRARRGGELDRGACRLRPPADGALPRKRDRLCARRLPGDGAARPLARHGAAGPGEESRKPRRSSSARPGAEEPDLARTLQAIASDGWYGFYDGDGRREMVRWSAGQRRLLHAHDLQAQRARWAEPIKGTYRGVTIYETPPPTQASRCSRC
jgi:gamma-glutamyltranspeptidase/glutathione hydrolase